MISINFNDIFEKTDNHAVEKEFQYATENSACVDLFVGKDGHGIVINPNQIKKINLGLKIKDEFNNKNYNFKIYIRSGLSLKNGLSLVNGVGVIDSDYKNEIGAIIVNLSDKSFEFREGERICQIEANFRIIFGDIEYNLVRSGGFGSSGK